MKCIICREEYESEVMIGDKCRWCKQKQDYGEFAASVGLTAFPDPTGERYVYGTDGTCRGKKSECPEMMSELWNALAMVKGRPDLVITD